MSRPAADIHHRIASEAAALVASCGRPHNNAYPALCALLIAARNELIQHGSKRSKTFDFSGRRYRARVEGWDRVVVYFGRKKLASTGCWES